MEDKIPQDNIKIKETSTSITLFIDHHMPKCQGEFPTKNREEAEIVERVCCVHDSVSVKSGVLGCENEPDSEEKLTNSDNSGKKFRERMGIMSDPGSGVDEFLQNDQHPDNKSEYGSGRREKMQDTEIEGGSLDENPGFLVAETAEKSMLGLSEQQDMPSSGISGVKRKARTSEINNEQAASSIPSVAGSQRKWYCSLCEVSTTSEGTLNHHMQGKKHKAKVAKYKSNGTTTSITNMDCDSSHSSLQPVGPTNGTTLNVDQTLDTNKWHCSICQVSTTSEALLTSHLQGKKHKSKEARLGFDQKTGNLDDTENVKTEEMTNWYCSLCQVYAASEKNLQEHMQGKKHKAKVGGENPAENEQETFCNTIGETGEKCKNVQEMKEASLDKINGVDQSQEMRGELRKYWHCKMCNLGTHDEASMDAHRKSDKHREALRENCGGVIVVSTIMGKE